MIQISVPAVITAIDHEDVDIWSLSALPLFSNRRNERPLTSSPELTLRLYFSPTSLSSGVTSKTSALGSSRKWMYAHGYSTLILSRCQQDLSRGSGSVSLCTCWEQLNTKCRLYLVLTLCPFPKLLNECFWNVRVVFYCIREMASPHPLEYYLRKKEKRKIMFLVTKSDICRYLFFNKWTRDGTFFLSQTCFPFFCAGKYDSDNNEGNVHSDGFFKIYFSFILKVEGKSTFICNCQSLFRCICLRLRRRITTSLSV